MVGCLAVLGVVGLWLAVVAAVDLVVALVLWPCWNLIVPALGGPSLGYWQTFGGVVVLSIVVTILSGLFRGSK